MSRTIPSRLALVALPLLAGIVLAAPAAEARVGFGLTVPLIVAPPVVVAPPYYVLPPGYSYAPPPSYFWYDRFGRRHWAH